MTRSRKPSPQTLAVILALAEQPSHWSHGYDLCQMLDLKAGTVYPILMRLAERGYLETRWETETPPGRPPRHLYRLTQNGLEYARGLRKTMPAANVGSVAQCPAAVVNGAATVAGARA